jgi:spermidine synthase
MSSSIAAVYMFVSGCAALVYEILWSRDLAYVFGGSAAAIAPVVAAFLTGLALGAWLAGRRVVARPGLLGVYARLELAIALFAPLVPWLVGVLDRALLDRLWPSIAAVHAEVFARFVVAFVVMVPATACMGATLPVLCAACVGAREKTGALIGRLYGWNTIGGVVGCLLAGFFLVEYVGLWGGRLVAAALNLLLALAAWRRGRRPERPAETAADVGIAAATPGRSAAPEPAPALRRPLWIVLLVASAAISIALELGWTRLVALGVGGTTYSFSIVLAVYLAGLGLGALAYASSIRRGVRATTLLTLAQLLLAALLLATHPLADDLIAGVGRAIFDASGRGGAWPFLVRGGMGLLLCGALVLLPALLLGLAFPALSDLNVRERARIGGGVGGAYLWSTLGGVAGSVAATWWLLPTLGIEDLLLAAAGGALLLGVLLVVTGAGRGARPTARRLGAAAAAGVAGVGALALVATTGRWDAKSVYGGVGLYGARALAASRELLEAKDGPTCSVAVFDQKGERSLSVNGKVDASTVGDMSTQALLAWLPAFFVDDAREIFVLGYGAGVTAASGAKWGARVECAEIEPAVLGASHWFSAVNGHAERDPAIELVVDDGRSRLRRSRRAFDVITTEPSNPWLAGMASLFTVEFYELCRARMRPGGVLCQWVQLYWSSPADYQAIFATLGSVFPEVAIWRSTSGDTLMLGSQRSLRFDPARIERQAASRPWLASAFAAVAGAKTGAEGLVATLARMVLLEGADARAFADAGPRRIRDDLPFLEFTAARNMLKADSIPEVVQRIYAARRTPLYGEAELARALPESIFLPLLRDVAADALRATHGDGGDVSRAIAAGVAEPLLAEAARRAARLDQLPFWRWLCARRRGDAAAESARLDELLHIAPTLLLQVAEEHSRMREFDLANAMLARLEQAVGANAGIEYERGQVSERAGDRREAVRRYERALKLEPEYAAAREALRELAESK